MFVFTCFYRFYFVCIPKWIYVSRVIRCSTINGSPGRANDPPVDEQQARGDEQPGQDDDKNRLARPPNDDWMIAWTWMNDTQRAKVLRWMEIYPPVFYQRDCPESEGWGLEPWAFFTLEQAYQVRRWIQLDKESNQWLGTPTVRNTVKKANQCFRRMQRDHTRTETKLFYVQNLKLGHLLRKRFALCPGMHPSELIMIMVQVF